MAKKAQNTPSQNNTANEFFDALIATFKAKNNASGIPFVDSIKQSFENGYLSAKQCSWITKNAGMHKVSISPDLQDFIDAVVAVPAAQVMQPTPVYGNDEEESDASEALYAIAEEVAELTRVMSEIRDLLIKSPAKITTKTARIKTV